MAKVERPTSIEVGPFIFSVVYDRSRIVDLARTKNQDVFGITLISSHEIVIDGERPEQAVRETTLHEALHVCWHTYSVTDQEVGDVEEQAVSVLATVMLDVLRSNPVLVAYLTGD
jgi:hypothetical protein